MPLFFFNSIWCRITLIIMLRERMSAQLFEYFLLAYTRRASHIEEALWQKKSAIITTSKAGAFIHITRHTPRFDAYILLMLLYMQHIHKKQYVMLLLYYSFVYCISFYIIEADSHYYTILPLTRQPLFSALLLLAFSRQILLPPRHANAAALHIMP